MTGCSIFRCPYEYSFDLGSKTRQNGHFGTFSDFTHLLDRFKTSGLVRGGQGTSPDGVEGLIYAHGSQITLIAQRGVPKNSFGLIWAILRTSIILWEESRLHTWSRVERTHPLMLWKGQEDPRSHISYHGNIKLGMSRKTPFRAHLASGGIQRLQRPNQTDNSRNQSCLRHVGGVWKQVVGSGVPIGPSAALNIPKKSVKKIKFPKKNTADFFFFLAESCRVTQLVPRAPYCL